MLTAIAYTVNRRIYQDSQALTDSAQSELKNSLRMDGQKSSWWQTHQCSVRNGCRGEALLQNTIQQQANLNSFSQLQPFSPSRQRLEAVSVWLVLNTPWPTVWDARDMHHGNMKIQHAAFPQYWVLNYKPCFPHLPHIFWVGQTHRPSLLPSTLQTCNNVLMIRLKKSKNKKTCGISSTINTLLIMSGAEKRCREGGWGSLNTA